MIYYVKIIWKTHNDSCEKQSSFLKQFLCIRKKIIKFIHILTSSVYSYKISSKSEILQLGMFL